MNRSWTRVLAYSLAAACLTACAPAEEIYRAEGDSQVCTHVECLKSKVVQMDGMGLQYKGLGPNSNGFCGGGSIVPERRRQSQSERRFFVHAGADNVPFRWCRGALRDQPFASANNFEHRPV